MNKNIDDELIHKEMHNDADIKHTETYTINGFKFIKQKKIRRFIDSSSNIMPLILILTLLLLGASVSYYLVPVDSEQLPFVQESEYLNIYNKSIRVGDIELIVQAIYSDQISTYVRIGSDDKVVGIRTDRDSKYNSNKLLIERIEYAYLMDSEGKEMIYKNPQIYEKAENVSVREIPQILNPGKLTKDEAIVVFNGGPKEDTVFSIFVKFIDVDNYFLINDLTAKIPPVDEKLNVIN